MDITFIIVLWVIISIIEAVGSRKKNPPPQVPPNDSDDFNFEIPTLANAPNKTAEVQEINLAELYRQKKQAAQTSTAAKIKPEEKIFVEEENKNIDVEISPASAMNAIILSEILDKPKALRKKKF